MDMAGFNNQYIINSWPDEQVDDGFFGIKPFLSEVFPAIPYCNSESIPIQMPQTCMKQKFKQLNDTNLSPSHPTVESSQKGSSPFSTTQFISFGKSSPYSSDGEKLYEDDIVYNSRSPIRRTPIQAQYHVAAERKRREKLSDLFIALSKLVPGLKKLDKTSVLEDATKHIEELQERLKTLEEGEKNNSTAPNTMVERCIISTCSDNTSSFKGTTLEQIPEIKVKIQGKSVLIKILCEKKYYGSISSMSTELEKLHLTILDTRILRFGSCTLDITLKAQMDSAFSVTVEDIIEHLQLGIFQLQS
ncbi:transcription factor bHLH25-like [Coffea arabica]|uniref:Transcription factor bHLH18-like isoform X2 n=1 Tax=Coffea arabica TaxID=13443 RepID=A0A6P6UU11_COFAR|nr:transcription factor bHLH18-like isoform X2 [Coffea arabica]